MLKTFELFAAFPEDVPVPVAFMDRLAGAAPTLFGMTTTTKRPQLRARAFLTGLRRLSLLLGSAEEGFYMHDIVRDFARSRCRDIRRLHADVLDAILAARPDNGWPKRSAVARGGAEWYVATHTSWHVRRATTTAAARTAAPPPTFEAMRAEDVALVHRLVAAVDQPIKQQVAVAVGQTCLVKLAEAAEKVRACRSMVLLFCSATIPNQSFWYFLVVSLFCLRRTGNRCRQGWCSSPPVCQGAAS